MTSAASVAPLRAPFVWPGGKSRAASLVWDALGDVTHYVEPCAGTAAVLLARPHSAPTLETINDADGFVANFWRALRAAPADLARLVDWPVSEVDLHARHAWLISRAPELRAQLLGDPDYYDARAAAWWAWGVSLWIGDGWCVQPSAQIPALGSVGSGVHRRRLGGDGPVEERVPFATVAEWFDALARRLRRVRIACGDWSRVCGSGVLFGPLTSFPRGSVTGVFFDPPYAVSSLGYAGGDVGVSAAVGAWCREHGADPRLRIVLAGQAGEHELPGWRTIAWKRKGGWSDAQGGRTRERERLWLSPHCVDVAGPLFGRAAGGP